MTSLSSPVSLRFRYMVKSLFPRRLEIAQRQAIAQRKLPSVRDVWPILEPAGNPPAGWRGWPDNKQFAVVLSHDVDTQRGLDRCLEIADLEESLGFRSAFYFVPEKRYTVPRELRETLVRRGFEVGVHGLYHDWRTFTIRRVFEERAPLINRYIKEWGAVGFRAPSMIGNLDWIRELDVEYDASTFDTDPFEPQPDGAGTIFPFWIDGRGDRPGYVELPYTMPQDFTLFVLLQARSIDVWKQKLAWIAGKGGMCLFDVHPCYADPTGVSRLCDSYPLGLYESFLRHVKEEYKDRYWHTVPRELARWWRSEHRGDAISEPARARVARDVRRRPLKIWIDLDNTPHVPFFRPIIRDLESRGYEVVVTARDAFQVWELADRMGLACAKIGRHYGKHQVLKGIGLCYRAAQLAPLVLREKPDLAVSHGSRSQVILSSLLRIPCVVLSDYEHARGLPVFHPTYYILPDVIPDSAVSGARGRVLHYPGIKEDVYAPDFVPDPAFLGELGISGGDIIVTVRPPATEAHYRAHLSDVLFDATMEFLLEFPGVRIILVPRNKRQIESLKAEKPAWFAGDKIVVPTHAVDGLNLLWHSDAVISGGGTMNREAAALGVPVYSIFGGAVGEVDKHLESEGKLVFVRDPKHLRECLVIGKRDKNTRSVDPSRQTLKAIVSHLVDLMAKGVPRR